MCSVISPVMVIGLQGLGVETMRRMEENILGWQCDGVECIFPY